MRGFSLIELVVVIIIIGVLAAVVLPRIIGFGTQARVAALNGLAAAVHTAATQAYAYAFLTPDGSTKTFLVSYPISIGGMTVDMYCGYPTANTVEPNISDLVIHPAYSVVQGVVGGRSLNFQMVDAPDPANCAVAYIEATPTQAYGVQLLTSGC